MSTRPFSMRKPWQVRVACLDSVTHELADRVFDKDADWQEPLWCTYVYENEVAAREAQALAALAGLTAIVKYWSWR